MPHLRPGLSPAAASQICQHECRARCCRGPLLLRLTADEARTFANRAASLGIALHLSQAPDGGSWVRFAEHPGTCCPMLDRKTAACRIYDDRPQRCRDFPDRATPGCPISGDD